MADRRNGRQQAPTLATSFSARLAAMMLACSRSSSPGCTAAEPSCSGISPGARPNGLSPKDAGRPSMALEPRGGRACVGLVGYDGMVGWSALFQLTCSGRSGVSARVACQSGTWQSSAAGCRRQSLLYATAAASGADSSKGDRSEARPQFESQKSAANVRQRVLPDPIAS